MSDPIFRIMFPPKAQLPDEQIVLYVYEHAGRLAGTREGFVMLYEVDGFVHALLEDFCEHEATNVGVYEAKIKAQRRLELGEIALLAAGRPIVTREGHTLALRGKQ